MRINAEPKDDYTVLHLRGEFDTYYCPLLQTEIDGLVSAGVVNVVLNMRLVKFINSTALGAIIKASKALRAENGQLVIARPSTFCRDIIEKVGLDRVVPVFETDEAAGASLVAGTAEPSQNDGERDPMEDEASVLFTPVDPARIDHFIPVHKRGDGSAKNPVHDHKFGSNWRGVGRMSALDVEGVRFTWNGGRTSLTPFEMGQLLALGTELTVKFRLPLLQKGHCEAVVTIDEVEERAEGVKIGASFTEIDDETREAVRQYSEDMRFLKDELKEATREDD